MSVIHRRRLGIPDGHIRLYGQHVPEVEGRALAKHAYEVARRNGADAARAFVLSDRPDWRLVEELCAEHMTVEEIAEFFSVPAWYIEKETTHLRRIKHARVQTGRWDEKL